MPMVLDPIFKRKAIWRLLI